MKSFGVSKDSWHYELAREGGFSIWGEDNNICTYTRKVILGLFLFIFKSTVVLVLLSYFCFFTGALIYALISSLVFGFHDFSVFAVTGALSWFFGLLFFMLERLSNRQIYMGSRNTPKKEHGFIGVAYNAFKEKCCFRVEIKE